MPCTLSTKIEPDSRGTSPAMTTWIVQPQKTIEMS
jgi:hypothetical protein